jgi:fermentation-respiration switch protein FrsA (DUF1100 family)
MRIDVQFDADGTTLRGWLYMPDRGARPFPIVVMAHGFSALKEMGLDQYAEVFARAGLAALVYDNRNLGASEGNPRFEIDPIAQMRDYRHAITYAQTRAEIRPDRIGVWGTSYTGGLVLMVAALDRRVKCVVSQVPFISGYETMIQVMTLEERKQFYDRVQTERLSLAAGNPPSLVAVCTNDTSKPIDAPGRRTYSYFQSFVQQDRLNWENKITLRSLDLRLEYEAMPFVARVSPTPLLMIIADNDTITPTDIALRAFEQAHEPKKIVLLQGDHYVPYLEAFDRSSGAARDWFAQYLL